MGVKMTPVNCTHSSILKRKIFILRSTDCVANQLNTIRSVIYIVIYFVVNFRFRVPCSISVFFFLEIQGLLLDFLMKFGSAIPSIVVAVFSLARFLLPITLVELLFVISIPFEYFISRHKKTRNNLGNAKNVVFVVR